MLNAAQRAAQFTQDMLTHHYNHLAGLSDLTASQQYANAAQNAAQNAAPPVPVFHKTRTKQEIIEQIDARYAELEAQARKVKEDAVFSCKLCKFRSGRLCKNALIVGIHNLTIMHYDEYGGGRSSADLCGPEKALWEPRLTLWQRFIDWLEGWGNDQP